MKLCYGVHQSRGRVFSSSSLRSRWEISFAGYGEPFFAAARRFGPTPAVPWPERACDGERQGEALATPGLRE